jgi:hypothetical protein
VASWTVFEEQVVRISPRTVSVTAVCERCVASSVGDGYRAATMHGALPLEQSRGRLTCPSGHQVRVERDGY